MPSLKSTGLFVKTMPAFALAATLVVATACLAFRLDWDRTLPLLLAPALAALLITRHHFPTSHSRAEAWLLIGGLTACGISTILSAQPARAAALLSAWILTVAGAIVAARIAAHARSIRIVLLGIAASALLGLLVVRVMIEPGSKIPLYGHARLLGIHLLVGTTAALAITQTLSRHQRLQNTTALIASCLLAGGMIWSGGRAPLLGFVAGFAVLLWLTPRTRRWPRIGQTALVLIAGLIIAICLGNPHPMMGWSNSVQRTLNAESLNALSSDRVQFWGVTFEHFTKSPLFGHGADSYLFIRPAQVGAQPHNFLLQWLGDFGIVGTLLLLGLLWVRFRKSLSPNNAPLNRAALFGAVACTVAALLDGGFYHAFLFMPAAVLWGLSLRPLKMSRTPPPIARFAGACLVACASAAIILNSWLYFRLKAPPPPGPHSPSAALLRAFPSNLHGLWAWLDEWKKTDPALALEWSLWAQQHAIHPELFGIYAARCQLEQRNFAAAEDELRKILVYLSDARRPAIEKMINEVRRQSSLAAPEPAL